MKFGLIIATLFENQQLNNLAPIGLGCIAASVKKYLPDVELTLQENPDDLINDKPDVIGISTTTEFYYLACQWAKRFKEELGIPVIIGGIHISLLPQSMTNDFDVAIIGEGDLTIIDLLQSITDNNGVDYNKLSNIPGLFFFNEDGSPHLTPKCKLIKDLDTLPPIDWHILPFYKEHQAHIVSARGCPYKCSFCASEKFARQHRVYSAESIIKDIEYFVVDKGLKNVTFFDDLLIANKKKITSLIEKLKERGLLGKCDFHCQVRANLVTEEICDLLNTLNIVTTGIGIESFSDKILKYYNKIGINSKTNQRAIDLLSKAGIIVNPSIIFGAPPETKEDMLVTLRAVYKNFVSGKLTNPCWTLLRPYPGTAIWEEAVLKGLVQNDMDWEQFASWDSYDLYMCDHVSKDEFRELIREWQIKMSLATFDRIDKVGGNFILPDRNDILEGAIKLKEKISVRQQSGEQDDSDLILQNAAIMPNNSAILIDGWYKGENGSHWINRKATGIFKSGDSGLIKFRGHVPLAVFKEQYQGAIEVHFYLENKLLLISHCTLADNPDGSMFFELPVSPNGAAMLTIKVNKSFIPRQINQQSKDVRELSIVITQI